MKRFFSLFVCLLMMAVLAVPVAAEPEDEGFVRVNVSIEYEIDTTAQQLVITLTDENGAPVQGMATLLVNGESEAFVYAQPPNIVRLSYSSVNEDTESVVIVSEAYGYEGYVKTWYNEARLDVTEPLMEALGYSAPTTTQTTVSQEAIVTVPSENTDVTAPTIPVEGRTQVEARVDPALAQRFEYSVDEMQQRIKIHVDTADYERCVGGSDARLYVRFSCADETVVNASSFITAKNSHTRYASYADDQVLGVPYDMTLYIEYADGSTEESADASLSYDIEMLLPSSLKQTQEIAFASCNETGVRTLSPQFVDNGAIRLVNQTSFGTSALVGFGVRQQSADQAPATNINIFNTWQTTVIFVVGVLLIVGGVVFVIVHLCRRRKPIADDVQEEYNILPEDECGVKEPSRTVAAPVKQPFKVVIPELEDEEIVEIKTPVSAVAARTAPQKPAQTTPEKTTTVRRPVTKTSISVDDLLEEVNTDLKDLDRKS